MLKREKKKKKTLGYILIVIAVLIFGVAFYLQTQKQKKDKESEAVYDKIRDLAIKGSVTDKDKLNLLIDWESLRGYPVVGWIKMGEWIDYPIVQGEDNHYYLKHSYDGTYNYHGSIFMSCLNNSDFMDCNTIIYGHNMSSGEKMFGDLKKLLKQSEDNPTEFYIYRPDGTKHTYSIYSIDKVKDQGYAYQTQFQTMENYTNFKERLKNESVYDLGINDNENKTVMLSTCNSYGSAYGNRVVVIGQETKVEQIQEPASWYKERNYIEINNKKAVCVKGNNHYYILQDGIAVRCRKEAVDKILVSDKETVIVRIEYEKTKEAYEYTELNGETSIYPIVDVIDYITE